MAFRTSATTIALASAALLLSGCSAGDDGEDSDEGFLQIETSAETETDAEPGSGGADDDEGSESEGEGLPDNSTVVLAGTTHEYTILCSRGGDVVALAMTGAADPGPITAAFGAGDPVDSISFSIDGTTWRTDSNGDYGEFLSLDVDEEAGTASGSAVFEDDLGETAEGTFDLVCTGP
ncbi:hypothetical protein ACNI3K_08760 [Demequina sp. SO4-13]|uniref:hypothetical protein n=1 Tax=Demequina sp. SO4-13 TaxID=3401027 RepID=UPI003AF9A65C